jgi:hypothetical protein
MNIWKPIILSKIPGAYFLKDEKDSDFLTSPHATDYLLALRLKNEEITAGYYTNDGNFFDILQNKILDYIEDKEVKSWCLLKDFLKTITTN